MQGNKKQFEVSLSKLKTHPQTVSVGPVGLEPTTNGL